MYGITSARTLRKIAAGKGYGPGMDEQSAENAALIAAEKERQATAAGANRLMQMVRQNNPVLAAIDNKGANAARALENAKSIATTVPAVGSEVPEYLTKAHADGVAEAESLLRRALRNPITERQVYLQTLWNNMVPAQPPKPGEMIPDYLRDKRTPLQKGVSRVRDWLKANKNLVIDAGLTGAGVTAGALIDKKNRLRGAAIGGGAGLLASVLGRKLYKDYTA